MSYQVVVVTGAASGIGAAIALSFAKLHANLCITDINEPGLLKISKACQKLSKNKILEVIGDITNAEDIENVVKSTVTKFGKIDVLVNCAGIFSATNLQDPEIMLKFDRLVGINLRSIVAMTAKAIPALIESKGCVINISSISSTVITHNSLIYSAVKAGVTTLTKCAAMELAEFGVRVNCISPGPVRTNIYKPVAAAESGEQFWKSYADSVPLKKCVKAEEIAETVVYLASDNAASITGADFVVDAGMSLGIVGSLVSPVIKSIKDN